MDNGGILNAEGVLTMNSGTLTVNTGASLAVSGSGNFTVHSFGTLTVNSGGTLTVGSGGTLNADGGSLINDGTLTVDATSQWIDNGGTISTGATGTTTNNNPATYEITESNLPYDLINQTGNGATNYNAILSHTPTGYSATGLPAGLSIDPVTGQISGTPLASGTGTILVTTTGSTVEQAVSYDITLSTPFITTWKTDNAGTSNSTSITIPTTGAGYNYDVDWNNDGIFDEFGLTGSVTHDFGVAGTYTIQIQ